METDSNENCGTKFFIIPQRYFLAIMGFFGMVNTYTMRVCLNIAIVEMIGKKINNVTVSDDYCPITDDWAEPAGNQKAAIFDWSSEMEGIIIGAFFYGYILTHIPGGILADRFGGKYVLGIGILCTSICTLFTPLVVNTCGPWGLIVLRFLEGLGEGPAFPGMSSLLAAWVPLKERSTIGSFVLSGVQMGTIITSSLSGYLLHTYNWEIVFYFFGTMGVIWVILFLLLCQSYPSSHPCLKTKERNYLLAELGHLEMQEKHKMPPWRHLLKSGPIWALVFGQIGHDWGFFVVINDLPKFMSDVLHFPILSNGLLTSLPYVAMWIIAILGGFFCDRLIVKGILSITLARKTFTSIASTGVGIFLIGASYAGCNRALTVTFFTIAMGLMGFFYCGMRCNILDLSPNYAGTIMAIINGIGGVAGIFVPIFIGYVTGDHSISSWRLVFWIAMVVFVVTNLIYIIWASGEVQYWDDPDNLQKRKVNLS